MYDRAIDRGLLLALSSSVLSRGGTLKGAYAVDVKICEPTAGFRSYRLTTCPNAPLHAIHVVHEIESLLLIADGFDMKQNPSLAYRSNRQPVSPPASVQLANKSIQRRLLLAASWTPARPFSLRAC